MTLEEIIDDVGVDAARFFFVMLSTDQPLTFDLQLAKAQSNSNPVYYVQYGHARIASLIRRAEERDPAVVAAARRGLHLERLLAGAAELTLMRRITEFGAVVEGVAQARAPHRLPKYARDIAADFHAFYDQSPVLPALASDPELAIARLGLALATQAVLARALGLCGISAPERMGADERTRLKSGTSAPSGRRRHVRRVNVRCRGIRNGDSDRRCRDRRVDRSRQRRDPRRV